MRLFYVRLTLLALWCVCACKPTPTEPLVPGATSFSPFLNGSDKKAVETFLKGMEPFSAARSEAKQADYYNNLGVVKDIESHTALALAYHTQALTMRQQQNDRMGIAKSCNNLAIVYQSQGDASKAFDLYEQAVMGFSAQAKAEWEAHTLRNFAQALQAKQFYERAKEKYAQALHIWQMLGQTQQVQLLTTDIAALPMHAGRSSSEQDTDPIVRGGTIRFIEEE